MGIICKWPVSNNGIHYPAGAYIPDLSEDEEEKLVEDGIAEYAEPIEDELDDSILTAAAFKALKPDAQKDLLTHLGLEPASNGAERTTQYQAFLDAQQV